MPRPLGYPQPEDDGINCFVTIATGTEMSEVRSVRGSPELVDLR